MGKSSLTVLLTASLLTGCSFIMPRAHDPVLFGDVVDAKILLAEVTCEDKQHKWDVLLEKSNRLKTYTEVRDDPQATNMKGMHEAIQKAKGSPNVVFCKSVIGLQQKRVDAAIEAWRGR